jgi:hypothetical protein
MTYLQARLDLLRRTQNPDGGWGYLPGKQSWLEPSVYASLCLHGEPAAQRAWDLISSWQNADGSWRPAQEVRTSTWATALSVTLAVARKESGRAIQAGAEWLLQAQGSESTLTYRLSGQLPAKVGSGGWSWTANSLSAVEPTAHAMVALKKASGYASLPSVGRRNLEERLKSGETRLLAGKREAAGFVLLGLQDREGVDAWVESAIAQVGERETPALARAWMRLGLRLRGEKLAAASSSSSNDLMLAALDALADEHGNYGLLRSSGGGGRA